jgi:hypothetical protein
MDTSRPLPNPARRRTRRSAIRQALAFAATLVVASSPFIINASPASAVGTYLHRICDTIYNPRASLYEWADFCVGFDYSGTTNGNRIRAYARVVTRGFVAGQIADPVNIEWVRLGDGNGVISTSTNMYSNTGAAEIDTPLNYGCHTSPSSSYNAHAKIGVNWLEGGGGTEWDFYVYDWLSVGSTNGACTNYTKTYNTLGNPYPPSFTSWGIGTIRSW